MAHLGNLQGVYQRLRCPSCGDPEGVSLLSRQFGIQAWQSVLPGPNPGLNVPDGPRSHAGLVAAVARHCAWLSRSGRFRAETGSPANTLHTRGGTGGGTAPHTSHLSHTPHRMVEENRGVMRSVNGRGWDRTSDLPRCDVTRPRTGGVNRNLVPELVPVSPDPTVLTCTEAGSKPRFCSQMHSHAADLKTVGMARL